MTDCCKDCVYLGLDALHDDKWYECRHWMVSSAPERRDERCQQGKTNGGDRDMMITEVLGNKIMGANCDGLVNKEMRCACWLGETPRCLAIPLNCRLAHEIDDPDNPGYPILEVVDGGPSVYKMIIEYIKETGAYGLASNTRWCYCEPTKRIRCGAPMEGCFFVGEQK